MCLAHRRLLKYLLNSKWLNERGAKQGLKWGKRRVGNSLVSIFPSATTRPWSAPSDEAKRIKASYGTRHLGLVKMQVRTQEASREACHSAFLRTSVQPEENKGTKAAWGMGPSQPSWSHPPPLPIFGSRIRWSHDLWNAKRITWGRVQVWINFLPQRNSEKLFLLRV